MARFFIVLAFSVLLTWPLTGNAQQYTKDDFAGMGVSAGQGARMAERANQSAGRVNTDTFSGMGINRGSASLGADRANRLYPYGSTSGSSSNPYAPSSNPYGSPSKPLFGN